MAWFLNLRKCLTQRWSSYCWLLWYTIFLIPIYAFLIPIRFYTDENNLRALILAFICGGLVGVTEIASRYRDEQLKAILSPDGLVYVLFNGAISSFALILIFQFRGTTPPFSSFKSTLLAAIAAGFGATAIMRTRFAVIKGSDGKEISIGPDIVINLLLSMIDRRIDRWRAARRQPIVADHFKRLKSLGSGLIDQTTQYLFASLLAFQNLSEADKQQFIDTIEANKKKISDVNIQFQALGFAFLTIVGEENFEAALEKAQQIKDEASASDVSPSGTVPTPTGTTVPTPIETTVPSPAGATPLPPTKDG